MKKNTSKILPTCLLALTLVTSACSGNVTKYAITVKNGTGSGTYDKGASVTITANEAPQHQVFDYWDFNGECVSKDNPYTFTVEKSGFYTAMYRSEQATITVVNGTGSGSFDIGSNVTITATVPQYKEFDHWEVGGQSVSTSNPYTFTVTGSATYTAIFKSQKATVTVVNGTGGGSYDIGSEATVTATVPSGKSFDHWEIDGESVSTSNPYSFTVTKSVTITAVFARGVKKTDTTAMDITSIDVSKGGTITIDYKYVDAVTDKDKTISLYFGSGEADRYGPYVIYPEKLEQTYTGVTLTKLDDGYNRLIVCAAQLKEISGATKAPTNINKVMFDSFNASKGVFLDITSEPIADPSEYRGVFEKSGNYNSITLNNPVTVSEGGTLVVDYKYVDDSYEESNAISMFFGSDETHRFGNYKLFPKRMDKEYSGISFTTLDDGYNRMTICVSKLADVRSGETAPTVISEISFKWFEAKSGVYFDVNPKPTRVKTTEFTMKDSNFKICNFTDLHVSDKAMLEDTGTVGKTMKYAINKTNPDIMVFSGDIAGSPSDLGYLFDYLDSYQIPYFLIMGNHDHEFNLNYDLIASYAKKSEYGYIEKGPDNFETNHEGNYTIKIKNSNDKLVHSLVMMSTGNKYTISDDSKVEYFSGTKVSGVKYGSYNDKTTYCDGTKIDQTPAVWDGIRGEQITWFNETTAALKCETTLVCHAGFNEYVKAYEQYQDAVNKKDQEKIDACKPIGKCTMGEQCCGSVENNGLFDAIKQAGTKNVICGHDHANDFSLLYDGVRLTYALKTGDGAYWSGGDRNGYTELIIDSTGATTLDQVYFNPTNN